MANQVDVNKKLSPTSTNLSTEHRQEIFNQLECLQKIRLKSETLETLERAGQKRCESDLASNRLNSHGSHAVRQLLLVGRFWLQREFVDAPERKLIGDECRACLLARVQHLTSAVELNNRLKRIAITINEILSSFALCLIFNVLLGKGLR